MKKILTMLLVLTMVIGLFAGCGGDKEPEKVEGNGKPTLTIGIPADANVMSYDDNALTNWLEEQLDCNLEFMIYSGGSDIATQIATTAAAGYELPDILWDINLGKELISQYGEDGYLLDLAPYFADKEKSKNFWMRYDSWDEWYGQDMENKFQSQIDYGMTEESGAIYSYPCFGYTPTDGMIYQAWINQTWLDKLGLPMPTNKEELYETLKAFKANDCNGNGSHDEIPLYGASTGNLGSDTISWLLNMFLYWDYNAYWSANEDGTLQNIYTDDRYREGLIFINKLRNEGLLSPLVFNGNTSDMNRLTTPATGPTMVGVWVGHLTTTATMGDEDLYEYVAMPCWGHAVEKRTNVTREVFITTDCPEENRDLAFQLLDLLFSEEGALRVRYGKPGENWKYYEGTETSPAGEVYKWEVIEDPLKIQTNAIWSSALVVTNASELINMKQPTTEWYDYKIKLVWDQWQNYQTAMETNPDVIYPGERFTEAEEEAIAVERDNCVTFINSVHNEFTTGVRDASDDAEWNKFLQELEGHGFQKWKEGAEASWARVLEEGYQG